MLDIVGRANRAAFVRKMTLQKKAVERGMASRAQAQLRREFATASKVYQETGSTAEALLAVDNQRFWWVDFFQKHHTKIGNLAAKQIFKESEKGADLRELKSFDQFTDKWRRIINLRGAKKVVDVSTTTKKAIKSAIKVGTSAGGSQYNIGKEIYNLRIGGAGTLNPRARARTIARTESQFAYQGAAQSAAETIPFDVEKEWVANPGENTRDAHLNADGQRVGIKETFKLEDPACSLMHPGDPSGPAEQVINCRCGVIYHRIKAPAPPKPSKPRKPRARKPKPEPKPKPVEVDKRVYRPGKTTQEAGTIAEELYLTDYAQYNNVSTEVANAVNRSLVNSYNKYGDMIPPRPRVKQGKGRLKTIRSDPFAEKNSTIAEVTTSIYTDGSTALELNIAPTRAIGRSGKFTIDDYKKDWIKAKKKVEDGLVPFHSSGQLSARVTADKAVDMIVTHEFGHMISTHFLYGTAQPNAAYKVWLAKWKKKIKDLTLKRNKHIGAVQADYRAGKITMDQLQEKIKPGYHGPDRGWSPARDVSRYAAKNEREAFSEIWVLHSNGGDYLLPPDIVKLLEELQDIGTKLAKEAL